jgi:hypothetical protein
MKNHHRSLLLSVYFLLHGRLMVVGMESSWFEHTNENGLAGKRLKMVLGRKEPIEIHIL